MDTRYISPAAFNACPPYQLPVGILAGCQVQQPPLSSELQLELALEDDRHAVNCRQILERAGAFPTTPLQQQLMGPYDCPDLDTIRNSDFSNLAPGGSHACMDPDPAFNGNFSAHDGSELYYSNAEACNSHDASQAGVDPFPLIDGALESINVNAEFFGAYKNNLNASSIATNFQQPVMASQPLLAQPHNPPIVTFIPTGLQPKSSYPKKSHQDDRMQLPFVQDGGADPSQLSPFPVIYPYRDITTSFPTPLPNEKIYSQSSHASRIEQPDAYPPPEKVISATAPFVGPQHLASSASSRARRPTAKSNKPRISPYSRGFQVTHGIEGQAGTSDSPLDNIRFYENPNAEREYMMRQPRPRTVTRKIKYACLACRLRKKACDPLSDGVCRSCQNIIRTYPDFTRLQNFTCDVRTKFSDLKLFRIPPDYPDLSKWNKFLDAGPLDSKKGPTAGDLCKLLDPFRMLIDFLESWHWRRSWNGDSETFGLTFYVSYLSVAVTWKDGILALYPDLGYALCVIEWLHYDIFRFWFRQIDHSGLEQGHLTNAFWLNTFYGITCAVKSSLRINESIREHIQSALAHFILHVYRAMLPARSSPRKFSKSAFWRHSAVLNRDFGTSEIFPPGFSNMVSARRIASLLHADKGESTVNEILMQEVSENRQRRSELWTRPSALLQAYLPSQCLQLFNLYSPVTRALERIISTFFERLPTSLLKVALFSAPIACSAAAKIVFTKMALQGHSVIQRPLWLSAVVYLSVEVFDAFLTYLADSLWNQSGPELKDKPSIIFPVILHKWIEEIELMQAINPAAIESVCEAICKII